MKLLIYGTGSRVRRYLEFRYALFFEFNEIVAFVDKNAGKKGQFFYGKPIIHPSEIKNYIFDCILIASTYEREIEKQLIKEFYIEKEKIKKNKDINELDKLLVEYCETKYNLKGKKLAGLYYDEYENLEYVKEKCKAYMNITEFYNYKDVDRIVGLNFDYIVLLDPKRSGVFDWKKEKFLLENEIIFELNAKGIEKKSIFRSSVLYSYTCVSTRVSYGKCNPDKTFLKISFPSNPGLVTIVFRAIKGMKYANKNGYIPVVDCQLHKSQYHEIGEIGKVNAWEKFFEQPTQYTMDDVLKSYNVISYGEFDGEDSVSADDINKYLKVKSVILKKIDDYCNTFEIGTGKIKILGCLCRGSDYTNIKPYNHFVQPTLDEMIEKVKEIYKAGGYNKIYLCSETQEAIERFEKEFHDSVIYYDQERCDKCFDKYLSEFEYNSAYSWGENYWVAINILARCDALVGGHCGGTVYAKTINDGKYEEVYLFDLGKYKC